MGCRTLVLSVDIGAGHRMAAEALCAALAAQRRGSEHRIVEALEFLGADQGKLAKELYFGVLEDAPGLWGAVYGARLAHDLLRPLGELFDDHRIARLLPIVRDFAPDVILAMHPIACGLAGALGRNGKAGCPVVAVLTDFDAHPSWVIGGIDLYLTATEQMARALGERDLTGARALATGIPLRPGFSDVRGISDAKQRLGLDPARLTILLLGGGLGLGPIAEVARALASLGGPLEAVVIAGKNQELAAAVSGLATPALPLHVRGLVENVWDYMSAADLAVGKPGGLTCAELLAAGVPLVALAPIPGQEQANCDVLVRAGVAVAAPAAEDAVAAVRRLLASPDERESMRQAAWKLGRPGAARAAAREVLALVDAHRAHRARDEPAPVDEALRALKKKLGLD